MKSATSCSGVSRPKHGSATYFFIFVGDELELDDELDDDEESEPEDDSEFFFFFLDDFLARFLLALRFLWCFLAPESSGSSESEESELESEESEDESEDDSSFFFFFFFFFFLSFFDFFDFFLLADISSFDRLLACLRSSFLRFVLSTFTRILERPPNMLELDAESLSDLLKELLPSDGNVLLRLRLLWPPRPPTSEQGAGLFHGLSR
jgi:hypothetical protein